ncbi:prolipoprotein diacylglyceryl transferase [Aurantimonas sp. MSK8Z-1]|uniref:prolipoprotein diacylglyceryl transferase n=1 Tax=Mangrovibrevibacter kandeliae TaxID=2968473 RepID=UPI002117A01C|nr:prolipoprotein diacylglyceryl transferase [Aurantimonas sp. MSK8Z-1]MCW4113810.1 prolipoprotein diacylglyceryl transferase [Aurantimonas sp. MSK8Z-1]
MSSLSLMAILSYPNIDPVLLQLGPVRLHWYGLAYVAGILCGWLYARSLAGNPRLWANGVSPISKTDIDDFILWVTLGIVVGGRLGSILFYDFGRYLEDPLAAFAIWEGGMSFHGGLVGVVLALVLFTRSRRLPLFSLIDVVAAVVPFGLFFGRIANFINGELWGAPSDVPWAMVFPTGGDVPRHPSQLYEAGLEGIALFLLLRLLTHHFKMLRKPRFVGSAFLGFYACSRIFVEFFRMPDVQLGYLYGGWLTMGMVLSVPMLFVAAWGLLTARERTYAPRLEPGAAPAAE